MTNISGLKLIPIIVGDADGLIALVNVDDKNHNRAVSVVKNLYKQQATIIFPLTAVVEAVTALQRKLSSPLLAEKVVKKILENELLIEPVDQEILLSAVSFFNPRGSKQNTLFDAIVAATAKKRYANKIFSFDHWYATVGLKTTNSS